MTPAALPRVGEVVETARQPSDDVLWSVTTLIGACTPIDALVPWAVNETAERTVSSLDRVIWRKENEGAQSAIDYVKGLRWQLGGRLTDTALGTVAHGLFEQYALTGTRPDVAPELHPEHAAEGSVLHADDAVALVAMLDQFDRHWLQEFQPDYEAAEVVVYHPRLGYAGQTDGFASVQHIPYVVDYKTSRKTYDRKGNVRPPYPEVAPQLAAYRYAEKAAVFRARRYTNRSRRYYLLSAAEKEAAVDVPAVEGGLCVKVTPAHCGVYPVNCGPDVFAAFTHMIEVARWQFNLSAWAVSHAMDPPFPAAVDDPFAGLPTY